MKLEKRHERVGSESELYVVTVMQSKFNAGSRCDKGRENGSTISSLNWHGGCSLQRSSLGWRHGAETAFPAGNNNPTVVCCHGISTKMLFLSRSSQQNGVAHETVDLTLCFFYLL